MSSLEQLQQAEQALCQIFSGIDAQVKKNLRRVLNAFRQHQVGVHHFASVSGYGHDDLGRQVLDQVFAEIMGAEAAAVRVQFVSGTHAIAAALYGVLRPGDELLAVAGAPYDTLEEVIGLRGRKNSLGQAVGQGSLKDFNVDYRQLDLTEAGEVDWDRLAHAVRPETKLVHIQRSCGYAWRPSLSILDIEKICRLVKQQNPNTVCFVDNCYGEFVADREPTAVGADLMAGSLIKNPGGTIATAGGYVAGRADLVELAACRLTAPGIGSEGGATFDQNRLLFQGLFLAPQMVGEAIKGNHLTATVFQQLGYPVNPLPDSASPRCDSSDQAGFSGEDPGFLQSDSNPFPDRLLSQSCAWRDAGIRQRVGDGRRHIYRRQHFGIFGRWTVARTLCRLLPGRNALDACLDRP